jgi:hypothetical protein
MENQDIRKTLATLVSRMQDYEGDPGLYFTEFVNSTHTGRVVCMGELKLNEKALGLFNELYIGSKINELNAQTKLINLRHFGRTRFMPLQFHPDNNLANSIIFATLHRWNWIDPIARLKYAGSNLFMQFLSVMPSDELVEMYISAAHRSGIETTHPKFAEELSRRVWDERMEDSHKSRHKYTAAMILRTVMRVGAGDIMAPEFILPRSLLTKQYVSIRFKCKTGAKEPDCPFFLDADKQVMTENGETSIIVCSNHTHLNAFIVDTLVRRLIHEERATMAEISNAFTRANPRQINIVVDATDPKFMLYDARDSKLSARITALYKLAKEALQDAQLHRKIVDFSIDNNGPSYKIVANIIRWLVFQILFVERLYVYLESPEPVPTSATASELFDVHPREFTQRRDMFDKPDIWTESTTAFETGLLNLLATHRQKNYEDLMRKTQKSKKTKAKSYIFPQRKYTILQRSIEPEESKELSEPEKIEEPEIVQDMSRFLDFLHWKPLVSWGSNF